MKVTVTKAGGHNARVGSEWNLSKADAREAVRTGWATLTFKGAVCHVPVDCISPRPGEALAANITQESLAVFLGYANMAADWSGTPPIEGDVQERGNITQLKRAGLITTRRDDGETWMYFTEAGKALAAKHGVKV